MTDRLPFMSRLPSTTGLPVRRIVRRTHGGKVAQFPSQKSDQPIECESILELDFTRLCEVDFNITGILHQPCEISWIDLDHRKHPHIPDFAVLRGGRGYIIEVKPWQEAAQKATAMRTAAVKAMLAPYGIKYLVVTDRTIRRHPQLANTKTILSGLGYAATRAERNTILDASSCERDGTTIEAICDACREGPDFGNVVLSLVIEGTLETMIGANEEIADVPALRVRLRTGEK